MTLHLLGRLSEQQTVRCLSFQRYKKLISTTLQHKKAAPGDYLRSNESAPRAGLVSNRRQTDCLSSNVSLRKLILTKKERQSVLLLAPLLKYLLIRRGD